MPADFRVRLLRQGQVVERLLSADDKEAALAQLGSEPGLVLKIQRVRRVRMAASRGKRARFSLGLLLQELSTLLEAGLALIEALEALSDKAGAGNRAVQAVLDGLLKALLQGQPLSKAMAEQADVFPELLIATVASAEGSGQLPQALRRYQHYALRVENIRKQVVGALLYPAVVVAVGFGVLMFMLFFVIPRFAVVFESLPNLPATARVLLWWARWVGAYGLETAGAIVALIVTTVLLLRTARVRGALAALLWRLPRLRDVAFLFVLARFYRTVGLLIAGGTPVLQALTLSQRLLPRRLAAQLSQALAQLRAGKAVGETLAAHGLTTPVAQRLLRVGEHSGDLGGMCERIALFHDSTLDHAVEVFGKVFEPLLMMGVGIMVGTIVVLLYMPIFELANSMG